VGPMDENDSQLDQKYTERPGTEGDGPEGTRHATKHAPTSSTELDGLPQCERFRRALRATARGTEYGRVAVGRKTTVLGLISLVVLGLDIVTKQWALAVLSPGRSVHPIGEWMPITLAFNRGAAFGLKIGDDPRFVFIPITIVALFILGGLFRKAEKSDWLRLISVSLVMAGALGNLIDRLRWDRGVVDFLGPVDLGFMYWPIFNVADMAISCGAFLLAISFWLEPEEAAGNTNPVPEGDQAREMPADVVAGQGGVASSEG